MAMARELVTEKGIGERADAVWSLLRPTNNDHYSELETMRVKNHPIEMTLTPAHERKAVQLPLF